MPLQLLWSIRLIHLPAFLILLLHASFLRFHCRRLKRGWQRHAPQHLALAQHAPEPAHIYSNLCFTLLFPHVHTRRPKRRWQRHAPQCAWQSHEPGSSSRRIGRRRRRRRQQRRKPRASGLLPWERHEAAKPRHGERRWRRRRRGRADATEHQCSVCARPAAAAAAAVPLHAGPHCALGGPADRVEK